MTFTDLVNEALNRTSQTSADATTRIGRSINEAYRWLASDVGFTTIQRTTASASTASGNRFVTFTAEKLLSVYNPAYTPVTVLREVSVDELLNQVVPTDPPTQYAIYTSTASTVTIKLNCLPASIYTLTADALVNLTTLSGTQVPAFAEDFHDILLFKALAVEYMKMEKPDMAKYYDNENPNNLGLFQQRKNAYRYYLAVSASRDIYQGKTSGRTIGRALLVP